MVSIFVRCGVVVALLVGAGLFIMAPWAERETATLIGADGEVIVDDGSFVPVQDGSASPAHELIRYQMPQSEAAPQLPDGVAALTWDDLWQDGKFSLDTGEEDRVGRPTDAEFPEGTSAQDVMMFFLDIADMRSMQQLVGSVRKELDGKRVRIAGYTTPVGFAENETRFLLVPELGACIHVPPPPPNQIVYVEKAVGDVEMFAPVWVTGTLRAAPVATVLADVGYQLVDVVAEPYR